AGMEERAASRAPGEDGSGRRRRGAGRDGRRSDAQGAGGGLFGESREGSRLRFRPPRLRSLSGAPGGRRRPRFRFQGDGERHPSIQYRRLSALLIGGRRQSPDPCDRAGRLSAKRPPGGSRGVVPAAAFFLAATLLFSWPVAAHLNDGLADLWDAKLNAWILRWDYHQFLRDPFHLFDANTFYPSRFSLAFSENLLGASVFGFPLYAAGASTLTAYNVLFLLGMFLSALGAWALARYVTQDAVASCVAGLVYAFVPWRLSQVAHFQ